jgi:hypothetical protein
VTASNPKNVQESPASDPVFEIRKPLWSFRSSLALSRFNTIKSKDAQDGSSGKSSPRFLNGKLGIANSITTLANLLRP